MNDLVSYKKVSRSAGRQVIDCNIFTSDKHLAPLIRQLVPNIITTSTMAAVCAMNSILATEKTEAARDEKHLLNIT